MHIGLGGAWGPDRPLRIDRWTPLTFYLGSAGIDRASNGQSKKFLSIKGRRYYEAGGKMA